MIPSPFEEPAVRLLEVELTSKKAPTGFLLQGPVEAARLLHQLIGRSDREVFIALLLNAKHRVTHAHVVSKGTLDGATVHPREVFKAAFLANASAIVVGHNHPSGDAKESKEDAQVALRLIEAGVLLGVELLDSVIVTPQGDYFARSTGTQGHLELEKQEVADGP